jgi:hypothetical protein
LKDYLEPEFEGSEQPLEFQQDNATIHKTTALMNFLAENGIETIGCSPQSSDPISN